MHIIASAAFAMPFADTTAAADAVDAFAFATYH